MHAVGTFSKRLQIQTRICCLNPWCDCRTAISKVKDSVGKAISSVKGKEEEEEEGSRSPMKQRRPSGLTGFGEGGGGGPLSGLLGRAVGGMVATAVNQIGKQLQAAAEEAEDTYSAASSRVRGSRRLQEALGVGGGGNLQVGPVVSQGVSSSSINGVTSKNINLVFAVFASNGQAAQAQVRGPHRNCGTKPTLELQVS